MLNQGSNADGSPCSATHVCANANITQFSIGGNGILAPQGTYYTQGHNPFRLVADSSGAHLFVLDHDAPDNTGCSLVFGPAVTTCGDITSFSVDSTTGRLSYVLNSQVTAASGAPLPYFPVPANPIDFVLSSNYFLTLSGTPAIGDSVFPYAYNWKWPADHQPEQVAAFWHQCGNGDRCSGWRNLRTRQRPQHQFTRVERADLRLFAGIGRGAAGRA